MMLAPSISLDPHPHPALSYAGLRAEALELLGRLCGEQWSDFNTHDPGITILEQLCFALTELAYRANFPIEDLLASAGPAGQPQPDWQPGPDQILSGDPVSKEDLVALLRSLGAEVVLVEAVAQAALPLYFRPRQAGRGDIDLIKSAACLDQTSITPKGVLRIAAQLGSGQPSSGQPGQATTLADLGSRLHGARLLGRDFELVAHNPMLVFVKAKIEVEPTGAAEPLMAEICACLNSVISASASAASSHGLRSADLINALKPLPQVRQVRELKLAEGANGPFQPWHLALKQGGARLDPNSAITLLHRGLPLDCQAINSSGGTAAASDAAAPTATSNRLAVSSGRPRQLTGTGSLANQLPAVYGVGPAGLPAAASAERKMQADQLKTYLSLFDQLLADSQSQLAQAPSLLAPLADGAAPGDDPNRPALLAHLLSRFGEQLGIYQQLPGPAQPNTAALLVDRSAFLRRIVPLSGGRGSGPNQLQPDAAAATVSEAAQGSFAERLRRKLGLPLAANGTPPLLVIEHLLLRPLPDDISQQVVEGEDPIPFLSDVAQSDPWSHRVSIVINEGPLLEYTKQPNSPFELFVARSLREELPAHLSASLWWFSDQPSDQGKGDWSQLLTAWCSFRRDLALYRQDTIAGGSPNDPLTALRLRDSRDRLINWLGLGLPWPLRNLPLPTLQKAISGKPATINLDFSQKGVRYQLINAASGEAIGQPVDGTGAALALTTPAITQDQRLRVQASLLQLASSPPQPAAPLPTAPLPTAPLPAAIATTSTGRQISTLLAGDIQVVEGCDPDVPSRLLNDQGQDLPLLHPEGSARIADYGQTIRVRLDNSQEGVKYELINNAERAKQFSAQAVLSPAVIGTSGAITLVANQPAREDLDLAVRASIKKSASTSGQPGSSAAAASLTDETVLNSVLALRVRANPQLALVVSTPVVNWQGVASVVIGADASQTPAAPGSQTSVDYLLRTRPLSNSDWLLDAAALPPGAIDVLDGSRTIRVQQPAMASATDLTTMTLQPSGARGGGGRLTVSLSGVVNDLLVSAVARKTHRLNPVGHPSDITQTTDVPLPVIKALVVRPDASRQLILRQQGSTNVWSLEGGQPGVTYTVFPASGSNAGIALAAPLYVHQPQAATVAGRGIQTLRVGLDNVVASATAVVPPSAAFATSPATLQLSVKARRVLSGVETTMALGPSVIPAAP
jgi:hypothetical protein